MFPEAEPMRTLRVAGWHTNVSKFEVAQPDHMRVESSSCCFPIGN